jgi:hypothetical protein
MFDPTGNRNANDISQLAKRRLAQNRETAAPNFTVNFPPNFADIFRQPNQQMAGPLGPLPIHAVNHLHPQPEVPLPPMKLETFVAHYNLSDDLQAKLVSIHVAGPHVLSLISDADLRGEGKLSIGELASLRDAQTRWKHAAQGA